MSYTIRQSKLYITQTFYYIEVATTQRIYNVMTVNSIYKSCLPIFINFGFCGIM